MDKETRAKWEKALRRKDIRDAKMREIKDSVYRAPSVVRRNDVLRISAIDRERLIANDPEYADDGDA
jgi:hypothetical protein